jgi:hypothetical protein
LFLVRTKGFPDDSLVVGGVSQYNADLQPVNKIGVSVKIASALAAGSQASSANGVAVATHSAASIINPNTISIGTRADAGQQWNGFVERIALWPATRIANASLQGFTA